MSPAKSYQDRSCTRASYSVFSTLADGPLSPPSSHHSPSPLYHSNLHLTPHSSHHFSLSLLTIPLPLLRPLPLTTPQTTPPCPFHHTTHNSTKLLPSVYIIPSCTFHSLIQYSQLSLMALFSHLSSHQVTLQHSTSPLPLTPSHTIPHYHFRSPPSPLFTPPPPYPTTPHHTSSPTLTTPSPLTTPPHHSFTTPSPLLLSSHLTLTPPPHLS